MKLSVSFGLGTPVHHDVRGSFGELLREALSGRTIGVALGPLYQEDPASELLRPFRRSAIEAGYSGLLSDEELAPDEVLEKARTARSAAIWGKDVGPLDEFDDWARAGLVLEIARRRGIHVGGRGVLHVDWRLNATVTGRFGAETVRGHGWAFNPLSMGPEDRKRVWPSDHTRQVAVLDFKAMDVCSMIAVVPGLAELFMGHPDPYQRVADVTGLSRDTAKLTFLTWAYGGVVDPHVLGRLHQHFRPVHEFTKELPHGDFPRMVQTVSAIAFRAALSKALPLLTGIDYIPMFTVHDELTIDVSERAVGRVSEVAEAMSSGATDRIGFPYRVGVSTGYTYAEAKGD
ncbi:MAG TPA: hypothetical protein VFT74_18785 [Isosphaeraceae bacterium]|nr:hypothetical protein [Isosphaeraceae bacterium]